MRMNGVARMPHFSAPCRCHGWTAHVRLCPHLRIASRLLHMLSLRCYWRDMPLMRVGLLFRRRTRVDSAVAAVEADMVSVVNYGFIVTL